MKETKRKFIKIISLICIACISTTAIIGFIFSKKQIETRSINNYQQIAATNAEKISAWMGEKGAIVESVSRTLVIKNDFDIDLLRNYLTEMKKAFDDEVFCDLYFTYPDNKMACTNGFVPDGTIQFVQRPWYKKAVLSGEVHYESPYLDLDTKNYIVTVSKAIVVDGKLKGVLAADLYANQITSVMDSISLPKNS
ncbi:MAG: cache domain-containing protein, partial [Eubacteriales bacterium]|nr:cache domain-containing protein [Eubacteriales bacterium]